MGRIRSNSSSAFLRARVWNICEIYKSGGLINETESYYNDPHLSGKDGHIF